MSKPVKRGREFGPSGAVCLLAVVVVLAGCGPGATQVPTYTPYPTYTPLPTLAAAQMPTYTPYPTYTPFPTLAPAPTAVPTALPPTPPASASGQCSGTPVISSLTANPSTIQVGESATLDWGLVSNAQAAVLVSPDGRLGVPTPGQTTVQPDRTTTYSLLAICGSTVVQQQVTVNVQVPSGCSGVPSIASFTANPASIKPGETTTLSWGAVTNAGAAVLLSPEGKQGVATPGELVVAPTQTTTYVLVAFCGGDVVQQNVTVAVEGTAACSGAPAISSFTADPETIQKGQSSTLEWGPVANARGIYLQAGKTVTRVTAPGKQAVTPDQTTTYRLVAFCGGAMILSDVTITVQ